MKSNKVCPRCGLKYSYLERRKVGDRVYLYAVHYFKVGRKRRIRKCYLGPEGSYLYVSKMHEFTLRGPLDRLRTLNYLDAILNLLVAERRKLDEKMRKEIVDKLKWAIENLG